MKLAKLGLLVLAITFTQSIALAESVKVQVNGMVCSFCAQGITKKFQANPAVESVKVDLDKKEVALSFKKEKTLSDTEIEKMIKESGYTVVKTERQK